MKGKTKKVSAAKDKAAKVKAEKEMMAKGAKKVAPKAMSAIEKRKKMLDSY